MGTDIHYQFQARAEDVAVARGDQTPVKNPDKWVDICDNWDGNRHYLLFAVLADVRNGFGFAGSYRHEPLRPIVEDQRGYPDDLDVDHDLHWLGDHSHHWLLGSELMAWTKLDRSLVFGGIISREEFDKWDGKTPPVCYCGMITGPGVVVIEDIASAVRCHLSVNEHPNTTTAVSAEPIKDWTHIRIYWRKSILEELDYFFSGVIKPLMDEYGEIRMVMGFDS